MWAQRASIKKRLNSNSGNQDFMADASSGLLARSLGDWIRTETGRTLKTARPSAGFPHRKTTRSLGSLRSLGATFPCRKRWRRGWDLNPRMEVLQTSPLGLLGTAPDGIQYNGIGRTLSGCPALRRRSRAILCGSSFC